MLDIFSKKLHSLANPPVETKVRKTLPQIRQGIKLSFLLF